VGVCGDVGFAGLRKVGVTGPVFERRRRRCGAATTMWRQVPTRALFCSPLFSTAVIGAPLETKSHKLERALLLAASGARPSPTSAFSRKRTIDRAHNLAMLLAAAPGARLALRSAETARSTPPPRARVASAASKRFAATDEAHEGGDAAPFVTRPPSSSSSSGPQAPASHVAGFRLSVVWASVAIGGAMVSFERGFGRATERMMSTETTFRFSTQQSIPPLLLFNPIHSPSQSQNKTGRRGSPDPALCARCRRARPADRHHHLGR